MRVQKVTLPNNEERYILINSNEEIVKPVKDYLKYLDSTGRSRNTLKNYAHSLKLYFEFLEVNGNEYDDFEDYNLINRLSDFMRCLKNGEMNLNVAKLTKEQVRENGTINSIMSIVVNFYEYIYKANGIENVFLRKENQINTEFKSFLYEIVKEKKEIKSHLFHLREKKKKIKTITPEEYEKMLSHCKSYRDKFLISLMYESGIRLGEALGLFLEDIEVWDNKIKIQKRDGLENGVSVKNCSEGEIEVPNYVFKYYTNYITEEFMEFDSDYVFVNLNGLNKGKPMMPITIEKLFERLSDKIGKKVTPHMLRHTHATNLIEKGGWDPIDVKDRLRHANIQTTIGTYIHTSDKYKKEKYKEYLKQIGDEKNDE